jgi:hypothetical protein
MKRALIAVLAVLCLTSCAHGELKAPCTHPTFAALTDCGPLKPVQ